MASGLSIEFVAELFPCLLALLAEIAGSQDMFLPRCPGKRVSSFGCQLQKNLVMLLKAFL